MNVIVDLETLSTKANAAIVVIGAIRFADKSEHSEKITEEELHKMDIFYRRIKLDSVCESGKYHMDPKTVDWWEAQDVGVRYEALHHPERVNLKDALLDFIKWIGNDKKTMKIWGNGSSFDITILGEAFTLEGLEIPWNFWLIRDLRTLLDLGDVKMKDLPAYQKHHALWDVYGEIIAYQRSMKNLKSSNQVLKRKR